MKTRIFVFSLTLIIISTSSSNCQNPSVKIYFDKKWNICKSAQHNFYRQCNWDTISDFYKGTFTDYSNSGQKIAKGKYVNKLKQGEFIFYNDKEDTITIGYFKNDLPDSLWTWFHPNKKEFLKIKFTKDDFFIIDIKNEVGQSILGDKYHFRFNFQNDETSDKYQINGKLANKLKDGKWLIKKNLEELGYDLFEEGKYIKTTYKNHIGPTIPSKLVNNSLFVPYLVYASENFRINNDVEENDYPFSSRLSPWKEIESTYSIIKDSLVVIADKKPKYINGSEGLKKALDISPKLAMDYIKNCKNYGAVYFEFIIDEKGSLQDKKIIRSPDPILTKIVLSLMNNLGQFKPAYYQGIPVKSKYTSIIRFQKPMILN